MEQALLQAVTLGDVESVCRLVEQGVDINTRWRLSGNQSALHYAAGQGSMEMVNTLLASGANVATLDANESTPLHEAARCGHLGVVKALIAQPGGLVNVSAVDRDGATPLHLAAYGGHLDVMEVLLANGADLFTMSNFFHRTVGADLTATDISGRTVMHVAARTGCSDVVKALLAHGAFADTTALREAVEIGAFAVVKTLLKHGADVSEVDSLGRTPLHCVVNDDDPQENSAMAEILLKYGANVSAVDNTCCYVMELACTQETECVVLERDSRHWTCVCNPVLPAACTKCCMLSTL
ncbi:hypothetical protein Poli38472_013472 [Pythium oligandrum]|uniref:Ankyrin repeat protein n=1 Tax=Pythium oligandrum TaxID=41045 RepID=A0A8K1C867_PYTOL|nr:hypothetical protein Poli38472_013472 [Pythium oligandrum]|eukprot:TMW57998.1 hypothetical protein Poli38472_013472 [Pythium oligandrum]